MPEEHKKRIEASLTKYYTKQMKKDAPKARRQEPEKAVVGEIFRYCKVSGLDVRIYEAKGGMNQYGVIPMEAGHSDLAGTDPNGFAVYIEAKAPGHINRVSPKQYLFLKRKIDSNAFAVVVDRIELLHERYLIWSQLKLRGDHGAAKEYLLRYLIVPKELRDDGKELFD